MKNKFIGKNFIYIVMGLVLLTALMFTFNRPLENSREIGLNEVVELARSSTPNSKLLIEIDGEIINVSQGENKYKTRKEQGSSITELLSNADINNNNYTVVVKGSSGISNLFSIIISFLPLIIFGGILLFMLRQVQGNSNQQIGFGRSRAKLFIGSKANVTLKMLQV